jgi:DNA-binding transcriptional regulator YdaS (Cro superfamily)
MFRSLNLRKQIISKVLNVKKLEAIRHFGSQQAVADALGLHKSAVSQWGEEVPQLRAFQLKEIIDSRGHKSSEAQNSDAA